MQNAECGILVEDLKERTKNFALNIIRLTELLPRNRTADIISRQLLRSGTSVGANYRAACRARSRADFISKMGIVEEEADEALYWLELLLDAKLVNQNQIQNLMDEANAIIAIVVTSIKTARKNKN
ncbi:MAG: four helix bundle protein [Candidatus Brocadiales bacterium]